MLHIQITEFGIHLSHVIQSSIPPSGPVTRIGWSSRPGAGNNAQNTFHATIVRKHLF